MFTLSVLPPRRPEEPHFHRHNETALVEDGHCVSHLYTKAARLQISPAALCGWIMVALEPPEYRYHATRRLRDTSATNASGGGKIEPPGRYSTRLNARGSAALWGPPPRALGSTFTSGDSRLEFLTGFAATYSNGARRF